MDVLSPAAGPTGRILPMPRRPPSPRSHRRVTREAEGTRSWFWLAVLGVVVAVAAVAVAAGVWASRRAGPERLRARAEEAARAGQWDEALRIWRELNRTRLARGSTYVAEARACLALDRAAEAERALRRAIATDPADPEPWRLLLELLRVEDRTVEAGRLGFEAYSAVAARDRRGILRDLTLALLADLPEDLARDRLARWIAADPNDVDALVARLRRVAAAPRSGDPDRAERIEVLSAVLERDPGHLGAREAVVAALADAGDPDRGRRILDAWPASARDDPRYHRLRGRWELDYDRRPKGAVESFTRVVAELPHDWPTHYRLARALQALGRSAEARQAADTVGRLRELLDPATLGARLDADLARPDDRRSLLDLADLCARAGLTRLAAAWRLEAVTPALPTTGPSPLPPH